MTAKSTSKGFVFAASGEGYTQLAEDAARSLRAVCPSAQIDLFTDSPSDAALFDKIHYLEKSWFRPKFEAARRSRFDLTIYLDADLRVLADITDIFQVLEQFELAFAHDQYRNSPFCHSQHKTPLPNAFPMVNSGVFGVRKSKKTADFLVGIERDIIESGAKLDQAVLREHLFFSDIRVTILPPEYNMMALRTVEAWEHNQSAPRVLHRPDFHHHLSRGQTQYRRLQSIIGPSVVRHIERMIASDKHLFPDTKIQAQRMIDAGPAGLAKYIWLEIGLGFARLFERLGIRRP